MVSNEGIITTFGTTGTLGNLDDTVDKMHSGLIKTLWNTATGSRVVSSGTLTQSSGVFTLATPVIYRSQGTKITLGTTASHGQATVTANSTSNDRYDLLYIDQSGNSGTGQLSIAVGTFNVNSPKVADLAKEDVPIAIIKVAAGAAASATHSFQVLMSTFDKDVLDNDEVTYAKIQNVVANNVLLGNDNGAGSVIQELTKSDVLTLLNVEDGADVTDATNVNAAGAIMHTDIPDTDTDFVKVAAGAAASATHSFQVLMSTFDKDVLDNDEVTYAKIQNVVANNVLLGNDNGAGSVIQELTKSDVLTLLNVEDGADVTDATNVNAAGAIMHTDIPDTDTGFVKRTGVSPETYDIDTNTYLTAESDTLDTVTGRGNITANDITVGTITSTVNQNLGYEVHENATGPIMTGGKTVVYVNDITALTPANQVTLPVPTSGNILHVINIGAVPITILGNPTINLGLTTHPKIAVANQITLAPHEHVTLQSNNDSIAPLVTGHMIISD